MITTAVMADLPVLSNMVTRLFESSSDLSESSIKYLIEALCHLSGLDTNSIYFLFRFL